MRDKMSVERILSNLIVNALHYTKENGEIRIYVGTCLSMMCTSRFKITVLVFLPSILRVSLSDFIVWTKRDLDVSEGQVWDWPIARELAIMQHGHIEG